MTYNVFSGTLNLTQPSTNPSPDNSPIHYISPNILLRQEIQSHEPFLSQSELQHFDSSHQITLHILLSFPFTLKKCYLRLINKTNDTQSVT